MSKAATELLLELGANVYAIDINKIDLPVTKAFQADMSQKEEIDRVIEELPEKIDALFLCHGIAAFPGKELLVQKVNFYSQKYMTEKLLDRISEHGSVTYISSVGGFGWQQVYSKAVELINLPTWEDAMDWYDKHPDLIKSAYVFAKQCGPRRLLLLRGEGQDGGHIGQQTLRSGHGQSPAAEVAQPGLLQLLRTEEALIPLVSRHDDGLGGGHGLQRRPGHPYEDVPRCHDLIDVGAWAGHHHAGASHPGVHRLRLLFQLPEHVAPSGDEQLHPGHRPVQLLRDLD